MSDEWINVLALQCKETSQAIVAARLRVSPSVVNQLLKRKYPGDVARMQALVEGAYMGHRVDCPIIGDMSLDKCLYHQARPFHATNPQRAWLYRQCRSGCKHSNLEQTIGIREPVALEQAL